MTDLGAGIAASRIAWGQALEGTAYELLAQAEGISISTLQRARGRLGIMTDRDGFGGGCWWLFPDHTFHTSQVNQSGIRENYGKYGAESGEVSGVSPVREEEPT